MTEQACDCEQCREERARKESELCYFAKIARERPYDGIVKAGVQGMFERWQPENRRPN